MTRKYFFIIAFILCAKAWSQDYKPLLDDFNEWHITSCHFGCLTDVYYTDGDTIVDGKTHKILDGFHYISRTFLLHEEVANKKVYLTTVSSGIEEYLLYDFSLTEGDSIHMRNPITPFPDDAGFFILDSIRSRTLADGNDYRHYYFSPTASNTISTNNAVWVEGVGSLSIINAPSGDPDINGAGHLSCFFKEAELFYANLDSISGCEPLILGLKDPKQELQNVEIYSSEAACYLKNTTNVKDLVVYDLLGRKQKQMVNEDHASTLSFDISSLEAGIYIIVIYNHRYQKRTFKIIVE